VLGVTLPIQQLLNDIGDIDVQITDTALLLDGRPKDGVNIPMANHIRVDRATWLKFLSRHDRLISL
jgi:hypothetical protein